MNKQQTVWIDTTLCTGCGACMVACPVEAITLAGGKAIINEKRCTGCQACLDVCPNGAIQPVVEGEIVPAKAQRPTTRQPDALAETAGAAIVVTGVGLLAKAAGVIGRTLLNWLTQPPSSTQSPATRSQTVPPATRASGRHNAGRGRQGRHRRRGRS